MRKLTTEQKAKAYDEAIKRAKALYDSHQPISGNNVIIDNIFPELRESEEEERTINCIGMCLTDANEQRFKDYGTTLKDCLAWLKKQGEKESNKMHIWKHWKDGICGNGEGKLIYLIKDGNDYNLSSCLGFECDYIELSELDKLLSEKQGGQRDSDVKDYNSIDPYFLKPTNKIEPKFHEGEWVFIEEVKGYKNGPFQIKTVDSFGYSFDEYHTIPFMYEELLSKWTIQDAKEGDVLVNRYNNPFIFKGLLDRFHPDCPVAYGGIHNDKMFSISSGEGWWTDAEVYPATQKRRDLLFQKMHEAGYMWDSESKQFLSFKSRTKC